MARYRIGLLRSRRNGTQTRPAIVGNQPRHNSTMHLVEAATLSTHQQEYVNISSFVLYTTTYIPYKLLVNWIEFCNRNWNAAAHTAECTFIQYKTLRINCCKCSGTIECCAAHNPSLNVGQRIRCYRLPERSISSIAISFFRINTINVSSPHTMRATCVGCGGAWQVDHFCTQKMMVSSIASATTMYKSTISCDALRTAIFSQNRLVHVAMHGCNVTEILTVTFFVVALRIKIRRWHNYHQRPERSNNIVRKLCRRVTLIHLQRIIAWQTEWSQRTERWTNIIKVDAHPLSTICECEWLSTNSRVYCRFQFYSCEKHIPVIEQELTKSTND